MIEYFAFIAFGILGALAGAAATKRKNRATVAHLARVTNELAERNERLRLLGQYPEELQALRENAEREGRPTTGVHFCEECKEPRTVMRLMQGTLVRCTNSACTEYGKQKKFTEG